MDSQHLEKLFKLCRVCGNPLAAGNGYTCKVSNFLDKLKEMFQVDFAKMTRIFIPKNCVHDVMLPLDILIKAIYQC